MMATITFLLYDLICFRVLMLPDYEAFSVDSVWQFTSGNKILGYFHKILSASFFHQIVSVVAIHSIQNFYNPRLYKEVNKPFCFRHFPVADLDTLNFSASCSCDNPASFLAHFNFSPNVILISSIFCESLATTLSVRPSYAQTLVTVKKRAVTALLLSVTSLFSLNHALSKLRLLPDRKLLFAFVQGLFRNPFYICIT